MNFGSFFVGRRWRLFLLLVGPLAPVWLAGCASISIDSQIASPLLYPEPPQRPRIQYLTSYSSASDLEGKPSKFMLWVAGGGEVEELIAKAADVAAYDGVIYVVDTSRNGLVTLNLKELDFEVFPTRGDGRLREPVAITIDEQGNMFVADVGRRQVVQYGKDGEFVQAFGRKSKLRPTGVAVDQDRLYVVDRGGHQLLVYDRQTGEIIEEYGYFGKGEGEFNIPTALSRDDRGHLFVSDVANFRVQEFDDEGNYIQSYGSPGDIPGTFTRPRGTAVDRDGHLYTVDGSFENVQIWDTSNAHVILYFGRHGRRRGDLYLPSNVHINYELAEYFRDYVADGFTLEYVILVTNNYGPNRLSVFGYVNPIDPGLYEDEFDPEAALEAGQEDSSN